MAADNFNLTWDNFEKCTTTAFERLYSDEEFTDVTLVCDEEKRIKAHKVILSACSPVFRSILSRNPHQHPLIYLKSISFDNIRSMIKFMYLGKTEVSQECLTEFLKTAKEFEIEGFSEDLFQNVYDNQQFQVEKTKLKTKSL